VGCFFNRAVLWTVMTSKEYSPEELQKTIKKRNLEKVPFLWYQNNGKSHLNKGILFFTVGLLFLLSPISFQFELKKDLQCISTV
jgi:maltose/moltooligosaccharide transporter